MLLLIHTIMHHSFADDLQLQMCAPDKICKLRHSMKSCISDVKALAIVNMVNFYDIVTELMLIYI